MKSPVRRPAPVSITDAESDAATPVCARPPTPAFRTQRERVLRWPPRSQGTRRCPRRWRGTSRPLFVETQERRSRLLLRDEWSSLQAPRPTAGSLPVWTNTSRGRHATRGETPAASLISGRLLSRPGGRCHRSRRSPEAQRAPAALGAGSHRKAPAPLQSARSRAHRVCCEAARRGCRMGAWRAPRGNEASAALRVRGRR
jgi:hypothetical protein